MKEDFTPEIKEQKETPRAFPESPGDFAGMTLRAYFAGQVIGPLIASSILDNAIIVSGDLTLENLPFYAAKIAVEIADALVAELAKTS